MPTFGKDEVVALLPHRGIMLLVDSYVYNPENPDVCYVRYTVQQEGQTKLWLDGHGGIMPGSLIVEHAQQGGLLLYLLKHNLEMPVIGQDFAVTEDGPNKFRREVHPGHVLVTEVSFVTLKRSEKVKKGISFHYFQFRTMLEEDFLKGNNKLVASGFFRATRKHIPKPKQGEPESAPPEKYL